MSLLSNFSKRSLRSGDIMLRSGKRVSPSASLGAVPHTGSRKKQKTDDADLHFFDVPEEILERYIVPVLSAQDLCAVAEVCSPLKRLAFADERWKTLCVDRWGPVTVLMERAAKIAGSWRKLYADKHLVEKDAAPWTKLSVAESKAAVQHVCEDNSASKVSGTVVLFLVDGSGSVTEEDFCTMMTFMADAVDQFILESPTLQVGVLQFSNDVRIGMAPETVEQEKFRTMVAKVARMNGGTNIAIAIQKAGQLLAPLPPDIARKLVFITDGRVDPYQAREAMEMAERLADEQANVSMYAFGVGKGVDKTELVKLVSATGSHSAEDRYYGLCVLDEPPW